MPLPNESSSGRSEKLRPVLIIDKLGEIGKLLIDELNTALPVIFVTGSQAQVRRNCVLVQFSTKIPHVPNNLYAYLFVVPQNVSEGRRFYPSLQKKAQSDNARLIFLYDIRTFREKDIPVVEQQAAGSIVIFYGDMFGRDVSPIDHPLQHLLEQAKGGHVVLPHHGRTAYYPLMRKDVPLSLFAFLETQQITNGTFFLFEKRGVSSLSIARKLMKHDPDIQIDFSTDEELFNTRLPQGESIITNDDLEVKLADVYDNLSKPTEAKYQKQKKQKKRSRRWKKYLWGIGLLVLILPYVIFFLSLGIGWAFLVGAGHAGKGFNFSLASRKAHIARPFFTVAHAFMPHDRGLLLFLRQQQLADYIESIDKNSQTCLSIGLDAADGLSGVQNVFLGDTINPKKSFVTATSQLKRAFIMLQEAQIEGQMPGFVSQQLKKYNTEIQLLASISDSLPLLFGFDGKRKYLILFQNNMELRPGGGFIGSYGIATLTNGKVASLTVHDVYDADGQLRGHIDPPFPLQRYMGASHWYLRDSNFSPDFPTDAASATRFLQLETGEQVDGVISLDVSFLKEILGVFGSIYVPDYNITVTPENFYLLTENKAERNFFPGSTQKKDFLSALLTSLQLRISSVKTLPYTNLIAAIRNSLHEKHMLLTVNEPGIEDRLRASDFAGSIKNIKNSHATSVIPDTFGISEANIGANKVNNYIKRTIKQHVSLNENGEVHEQVTVRYENTSTKASPFSGEYDMYVRLITPLNSALEAIAVDGNEVTISDPITDPAVFTNPKFVPPPGLEVGRTIEEGNTLFGFYITVPKQSERTIEISYTLPRTDITHTNTFSYVLALIKQPGTISDPYTLTIDFPPKFNYSSETHFQKDNDSLVTFRPMTTDTAFQVQFSRKPR